MIKLENLTPNTAIRGLLPDSLVTAAAMLQKIEGCILGPDGEPFKMTINTVYVAAPERAAS